MNWMLQSVPHIMVLCGLKKLVLWILRLLCCFLQCITPFCSAKESQSYRFETTWRCVNDGKTVLLNIYLVKIFLLQPIKSHCSPLRLYTTFVRYGVNTPWADLTTARRLNACFVHNPLVFLELKLMWHFVHFFVQVFSAFGIVEGARLLPSHAVCWGLS